MIESILGQKIENRSMLGRVDSKSVTEPTQPDSCASLITITTATTRPRVQNDGSGLEIFLTPEWNSGGGLLML